MYPFSGGQLKAGACCHNLRTFQITKIRFHTRNGTTSETYGTGQYVTNTKTFDLQAPDPKTQQVVGFFGSEASADNGESQCLGSIGIAIR